MSFRSSALVALLLAVVPASAAIAAGPSPSVTPSGSASICARPLTATPMSAEDSAAIDASVAEVMAQVPDLPGMWIGVWDPKKGYYLQAYGDAVKGGEKAAIDQHGRIGSVTKTFTTTAVLQQVAAGTLTLETTIGEVLPDLAAKYPAIAGITVEQLAGMTSGIPDYANTGVTIKQVLEDPQHVFTADELIDAAMTLQLSEPGTGGYSTTGTIILGLMLEKLTGKPVDQVVTELARSAGLTQSALAGPADNAMPDPSSHGYVESLGVKSLEDLKLPIEAGTDVTDWTASWGQAGGGMYSTVADLGTWAATGLGTCLLPADLAAKRLDFHPIPEAKQGYGLGVESYGFDWIGHSGQLIGWEALVLYNTRTGAAFTAIVNETGSLEVAKVVAAEHLEDLLKLLVP